MTPPRRLGAAARFDDPVVRRAILISLLVAISYYLTAQIGFEFSLQPGSVSLLWMPNSILLAGLLLTPPRWWWLVLLATLPAHLASEIQSGVPAPMVLSWFLSNSVQALIGASLINYFGGDAIRLNKTRDLTAFLFCGAFLAPFIASFLDSSLVKLNGWGNDSFWIIWRVRFLSNVLASLTVVPFVIEWVQSGVTALRRVSLVRYLEAGMLLLSLFGVALIVFNSQRETLAQTPSGLYWPLPFLVWATIRFGLRGISTALLVVMFLAIIGAQQGGGPFVGQSTSDRALAIQGFLILVSVPLLILAAFIEERQLTGSVARDNEERLTLALNAAQMGTWEWRIEDNKLTWSTSSERSIGSSGNSPVTRDSFLAAIHEEDRIAVEVAMAQALETGTAYEIEFRMCEDGITRWYLSKGKVFYDSDGKPSRMLGVSIDITDRKNAEKSLTEINERNRAILRAIPDVMFLQDKDGVYLDYYTRDPKGLLVPPHEFLGKSASEILPRELAERVLDVISKLGEGGEPQVLEYSLPIGNEERLYEARLVSAEGNHVLSMVRDVTDARRAMEAVRQSTGRIRALAARLITAEESERRRISILLHDDVGQNVAALGLAISRLKRKLPQYDNTESVVTELNDLGKQVSNLTTQIRQLSHQLHPEVLEHLGLIAALDSYVAELIDAERVDFHFSANVQTDPIPQDAAECLYRVALEAMQNVSRHSGVRSANVSLEEIDDCLVLKVSDSGCGFDVDRFRHGSGLGLVSAEERVRVLNGSLEVRSHPNSGTCLTARVPLAR